MIEQTIYVVFDEFGGDLFITFDSDVLNKWLEDEEMVVDENCTVYTMVVPRKMPTISALALVEEAARQDIKNHTYPLQKAVTK